MNSPYLSGNPTLQNEIGQISGTASNGNQSYNALQAVLLKRFSNGLEYSVAYTYSKCMTDSSGYYGSWGGQTRRLRPIGRTCTTRRRNGVPATTTCTHVLTSYATYDLPIGRNRAFGNNMNRVADAIIGGWQVNAHSEPAHRFPPDDFAGPTLPARIPAARVRTASRRRTSLANRTRLWADINGSMPASTVRPLREHSGVAASARSAVQVLHTLDFSLSKFFNFTENQKLEFRAEVNQFDQHSDSKFAQYRLGQYDGSAPKLARSEQYSVRFEVPLLSGGPRFEPPCGARSHLFEQTATLVIDVPHSRPGAGVGNHSGFRANSSQTGGVRSSRLPRSSARQRWRNMAVAPKLFHNSRNPRRESIMPASSAESAWRASAAPCR